MSKIVEISESNGFEHFCCDNGIGSKIFIKNDYVYKVCERNSLERVRSDYKEYRKICGEHVDKLQESYFTECLYGSKVYACIKQKRINGKTLNQLGREGLILLLKSNPAEKRFLRHLIEEFFGRTKNKFLYPDLVGNPDDQSIYNSVNIILEPRRGLVICDIGLSPHEDTLKKHSVNFYDSKNVKHYIEKMREALYLINTC